MKKHLPMILAIIPSLLVVICLFQIGGLKNQVDYLQSNLPNQIQNLDYSIGNISSNIDSRLEEQASIVAEKDYEYGKLDVKKKTVELSCSVIPKEFSPGHTTASILLDDQEIPMVLEKGTFKACLLYTSRCV